MRPLVWNNAIRIMFAHACQRVPEDEDGMLHNVNMLIFGIYAH